MNAIHIQAAVNALNTGGVIAYPTEYCFGIGCFFDDEVGLKRIRALKERPDAMSFIIIANDIEQIKPLTQGVDDKVWLELAVIWPAAISYLLPAGKNLSPVLLGQHQEIAVRIPDHALARELCQRTGKALVSTSANRRGEPPLRDYKAVCHEFGQEIDYVVEEPCGEYNKPSTLIRYSDQQIIRS